MMKRINLLATCLWSKAYNQGMTLDFEWPRPFGWAALPRQIEGLRQTTTKKSSWSVTRWRQAALARPLGLETRQIQAPWPGELQPFTRPHASQCLLSRPNRPIGMGPTPFNSKHLECKSKTKLQFSKPRFALPSVLHPINSNERTNPITSFISPDRGPDREKGHHRMEQTVPLPSISEVPLSPQLFALAFSQGKDN
jgi:hypothetical protein